MSKASHAQSTSPVDRRSILAAAGGIAAAGAVAVLPVSAALALPADSRPSPEFLEYRRCKAAWNACFVEPYKEDDAWEARVTETSDAVEASIAPFIERARAPRSWDDVKEMAEIVFTELWHINEDGKLEAHSENEDIETMFLRAALAMGGVYV